MQKFFYLFFLFFICYSVSAQDDEINFTNKNDNSKYKSLRVDHSKDKPKAKYDQYRILTLERDTLYIDTSLTIKSLYRHNYLRKDIFGLLPFANEGQTYNTLNFALKNQTEALPKMGFQAKHFNFYDAKQINYYSVATPFSELYFKTVMEQGQNLSTTITLNTSERLNFSIGFKGLRSLGKYVNTLSSSGNFVFTTNYSTKKQQYIAFAHFTGQDILNGENGGLSNISQFESNDPSYIDRARASINLNDATSFLKGRRFFLDHAFRINGTTAKNNLFLKHQINYENKFFEFNQLTVNQSTNKSILPFYSLFGNSYVASGLVDQTRYNKLYNKFSLQFDNINLGKFQFFAEDFRSNSYYNKVLFLSGKTIPSALSHKIQTIGGQYDYKSNKWEGSFLFSKAISTETNYNILAKIKYNFNENNQLAIDLQNISKIPNDNFLLYQSNYIDYNWSNNFKNENTSTLSIHANTTWLEATIQLSSSQNHLYFSNNNTAGLQLVTPKQYESSINYASIKLSKEFTFGKFALDNTLLFQEVSQPEKIINLPGIVTRNSIYFTDFVFKKAMYLQTGFTLNYFTKYYADNYNPVIGEFFIQKDKKIGGYPNLDFFVNGRIRQTRIFLIAENFNSSFSGRTYLTAPNNPFHDFLIRFGIAWNFFQ
jgi:Putative porin